MLLEDASVSIDLSDGTTLKKRGLNLRKADTQQQQLLDRSGVSVISIEIDYRAIKQDIRERVANRQEEALAHSYYYDMTDHETIPDWIRDQTLHILYGSLFFCFIWVLLYFLACHIIPIEDRTWPFIVLIVSILLIIIPSYIWACRNRRLRCRSFKEHQPEITDTEVDRLFDQALATARYGCITELTEKVLHDSRVRTVCTVSPIRVLWNKPVNECILKIEDYNSDEDC